MQNITCPNCGSSFELAEAYRLAIADEVLSNERALHRTELASLKRTIEQEARQTSEEQFAVELQGARADAEEQRAVAKQLRETLIELNAQLRRLSTERESERLSAETALREKVDAVRIQERELAHESYRLKQLEAEAKLKQALEALDRMRTRLNQGSQQIQGEVLELDLAVQLRELFPADEIVAVKKGQRGADVRQVVHTALGRENGTILWEAKNAQWQAGWISKLKADMRQASADHAVLISVHTPDVVGALGHVEGTIWVARPTMAACIGTMLRQCLLHVSAVTALNASKDQRMEAFYQYVSSAEFRHRVEAIQDAYHALQEELEREKRWFTQKWAREEKHIRGVLDNVLGLCGDIEGLNGSELLALSAGDPQVVAA